MLSFSLRPSLLAAASAVTLGFALISCGETQGPTDGTQTTAAATPSPASPAASSAGDGAQSIPSNQPVDISVALQVNDIGSDVTAVAALLDRDVPGQSKILAARDGGGVAVIDPIFGEFTVYDTREFSSMAVAPDFSLRTIEAPLIVGIGPGMDAPAAYLFLPEQGGFLPVPTQDIAPAMGAELVCVVSANAAALDVLVVGRYSAEEWRITDLGADLLTAEKRGDRDDARGQTTCGNVSTPGGYRLTAGAQLRPDNRTISEVAALPSGDGLGFENSAFVAFEDGGFAIADVTDGMVTDEVVIGAGVNVAAVTQSTALLLEPGNFGGSFSGGVVVLAHDEMVSVLALDQMLAATRDGGAP